MTAPAEEPGNDDCGHLANKLSYRRAPGLFGQWLIHRSDDRRYSQGLLRDAAIGVSTAFSQERAILTSDRRQGKATSHADETSFLIDRQQALSRLLTLPHGDAFDPLLARMGQGIDELWQAYSGSEEEWQSARARLLEAIQTFNAAVRHEMQR